MDAMPALWRTSAAACGRRSAWLPFQQGRHHTGSHLVLLNNDLMARLWNA